MLKWESEHWTLNTISKQCLIGTFSFSFSLSFSFSFSHSFSFLSYFPFYFFNSLLVSGFWIFRHNEHLISECCQREHEADDIANERDVEVLQLEWFYRHLLLYFKQNRLIPEFVVQARLFCLKNLLFKQRNVGVVLERYPEPMQLFKIVELFGQHFYVLLEAKCVKVGFLFENLVFPLQPCNPIGLLCPTAACIHDVCQLIVCPSPCKNLTKFYC